MDVLRFLAGTFYGILFFAVVHCQLIECDFENSTCQWSLSAGWIRSEGNASILDTGPKYVNQSFNIDGFYLHLNASQLQPDEKAYVLSPPILDINKTYCLSFYYLMHGKQVATLSVHVSNTSSTSNEVWAASFEHGPEWLHQEVLIENGRQVVFEGVFGGELGDIAIDDLEIHEGNCRIEEDESFPASRSLLLPAKCKFESTNLCGYHNGYSFKWRRSTGSTSTTDTGPENDHTYRNSKGHYMYIEADANRHPSPAMLISPKYKTSKSACIQFWYNMYGKHINSLALYENRRLIWKKMGSQGFGWKSAFVKKKTTRHRFTLSFIGTTGKGSKSDIAIDDISIQEGDCPPPVDCSFEKTLCAWSNTGDDALDWFPRKGKHSSQVLGPNIDHTQGTDQGTYLIIESNKFRRIGDRTRLVSTSITENVKTKCLRFWYNMNGKDAGELRVFIVNRTTSTPVWKLIGPQGGVWKSASVPLYPRPNNFWLVIEGLVGRLSPSYIAFDDISLVGGDCQTFPTKAAIGKKVTPTIKPTTPMSITVDPRQMIFSCNFSDGFCDWQQGKNDIGDWIRTNIATDTPYTGPKRDHTTGKGFYIYVEATNVPVGAVRLFSQQITPVYNNLCLKFWYFMYGKDVQDLRVYIYTGTFNSDLNPHWKMSGSKAKKWIEGRIFFQIKQTFQIAFEATLNNEVFGDIAVDDISLSYGLCNAGEGITTPKPGVTEKPIPIGERNCDFESNGICGYEQIKGSPNYHWIRGSGESTKSGPPSDHTTNSADGHYMYIEGLNHTEGTMARMISPFYKDSTIVCLQFYLRMYGNGIGNFSIYTLSSTNSEAQLIYNTTGDHGNSWAVSRVTINSRMVIDNAWTTIGYKLIFEATVGKNDHTDIALDDISFTEGGCGFLGDCNFEDDSCTWENVKDDDFDWTLNSGRTITPGTGPKYDHTLKNNKGHYMYIETSLPVKPGKKAKLVSALLPKVKNAMCLEFWYNMNGRTVDNLKISIQGLALGSVEFNWVYYGGPQGRQKKYTLQRVLNMRSTDPLESAKVTGYSKTDIWLLKGDQGKEWIFGQVPLYGTDTTYRITFEATSGANYTADIAIDDISFTKNRCTIKPSNARIKTTAPPHMTTTTPKKRPPVSGNFSCNFDNNFCGWQQDKHDTDEWTWAKGSTVTPDTGPTQDHTSGNGKYIYLETSGKVSGSRANFISPMYKPDETGINCVSFWYYMYGGHVGSLRVFIQYGMYIPVNPTWSEKGDQGDRWILGKFSFNTYSPFKVVLSAVTGSSFDGDIAVDDVSIHNGDCVDYLTNTYLSCDFEKKDLCSFTQGTADTYDWTWHHGETPTKNTGPHHDHTLGSSEGHYMYIKGARPKGWSRLISPTIHTTYTTCVRFYFHMRGKVGQIHAFLSAKEAKTGRSHMSRVWTRSGHQSTAWQQASFEVGGNFKSYEIMFEAHVGGSGATGDIALDDFSIVKGKCINEDRCDFEKGMCIWRNTKSDNFDWIIKKADGKFANKAPIKDHSQSTKVGHFLFVTTDHNRVNTKARIETKDFDPKSKNCLHFYFNGFGKNPGTLSVSQSTRGRSQKIWNLVGISLNKFFRNGNWHEARVPIPRTTRTFTISIEVEIGQSGYFAIDDISFDTESDCQHIPPIAHIIPPPTIPTTLASTTKKTTPKPRVASVSCHFTYDFCGWTQDRKDDINWIRLKGRTRTYATGPSRDHTSAKVSGYYIYIESSPPLAKVGDVARIISPKFTMETKHHHNTRCITFWYNMYGKTIGTLSLLLLVNGKMGSPIWKRQKSQGEKWVQGKVNIQAVGTVQVVFEANTGSGYFSDIALDDIFLHRYACHSIKGISLLPSCDFEGTCNYTTTPIKPFLPWTITSSSNHPNIPDHTYNTTTGEFMYVNMSGVTSQKSARIETPLLQSGEYCLEFFYQAISNFNGYLAVRTLSHGSGKEVFFKNGWIVKNGKWTIAETNLKHSTPFTVIFEAISKSQGLLAVDDIFFQKGVCPRKGSCDFERGHLCFWTNDPANKVNWEVFTGKTQTRETGPSTDHTKGNVISEGTYALLESSHPAKPGDWAKLLSQPLNNKNVQSCFQFWYSMNGADVASLSISLRFGNKPAIEYWILTGHQGKDWNFGQIPIPASKDNFQIIITGKVGGKKGDIGLDDFFMSEKGCGFSPSKAQAYYPSTIPRIKTTNAPIITGADTFNCTFEKGICGWVQSKTDDFEWTRNKGYTPSRWTGPQGDHTTGRGYYMFIEASNKPGKQRAELVFEVKNKKPGFKCMQFWYNMRGPHVGSLNIYVITNVNEQSPVWTKSGTQGITWNLAKVEFDATDIDTFKVRIEGIKDMRSLGDIAIDDVTLKDGGCREPYGDCDFEDNYMCGYKDDPTADFKWHRRNGLTASWRAGPRADHTYGTYRGHYMYIDASRKTNDTARLISPIYKALPEEHCLNFYYNMYGAQIGTLNVKIRVHDPTEIYDTDNYLHIAGEKRKGWVLAQLELPKLIIENPYQLIFEGVTGKGRRGDIAIDDIVINYGQCEMGGDCDFEVSDGPCTWTNTNEGDDFDWSQSSGATSTAETGPLTDHTKQNADGFYLYIDASFPRIPGQKAWYVSQDFTRTSGENRCLTFWYSMNGLGVGTLRVVIKFDTGGNNTLWELSKDQGNDWQFGQAPIESPTSYKIIFEGIRGADHTGDIALDDILFTEFSCSVKPEIATPRGKMQTLPSVTGTTPAIDVFGKTLNCTFDSGLCGWTQDKKDDFDWGEKSGPSYVPGTGPSRDHNSNGAGYYLYIPRSERHNGKKARLISPLLRPKGLQCFTVWYHMYGSDISQFNVYVFTGPSLPSPALHLHGTKLNKWLRADIQFNSKSPYNVILEGYGSWGRKGQIAFDDVSIADGNCPSASIGTEKFCNFENSDICGFMQDAEDHFNWERNRYRNQVNIADHTYGTTAGHFMFLRRTRSIPAGKHASLSTLVDTTNNTDLCINFWYYMSRGDGTGSLTVTYLTQQDNFKRSRTIFTRQDNGEQRWMQSMLDIDVSKIKKVQIKFYGIVGQKYFRLIGLDDVKISPTACKRPRGFCNFEKDTCNWVNIDDDDFDWMIGSGFTTSTESGPLKDHTLGTQSGSYLYIQPESNPAYEEDNSNSRKFTILESETFDKNQKKCLQFYYLMKGAKDGRVEVHFHPEGSKTSTLIWQLEGHQTENWTLAQVERPDVDTTFQLLLKGFRGQTFRGQIAIDDLKFTDDFPCDTLPPKAEISNSMTTPVPTTPKPINGFDCTFDHGFCSWSIDYKSRKHWGLRRKQYNGPKSDHTGGGYYLFLGFRYTFYHNIQATMISPNLPVTSQRCLSFYYNMVGEELNTLRVAYNNSDGLSILWRRVGPQGDQWNHATVNLPVISGSQKGNLLFTGLGQKAGTKGYIAIDDVSLYSGPCKPPQNRSKFDCDFENPQICGYTSGQRKSVWIRGSGEDKVKKELPDTDHTYRTGHGHYMYFNPSRFVGQNAELWSPKFRAPKDSCLKFWYRMSGKNIGRLTVYFARLKNAGYGSQVVWTRRGDQGPNWNPEYLNINQNRDFFVMFEGVGRFSSPGVAIDDVKVMPSCEEPADCTFEIDTCGWHNAKDNDLNWQRVNPRFSRFKLIPRMDHSQLGRGFGHYMYFTSLSYINPGKKGDLLSVSYDPTGDQGLCFEFWFIISGYKYGNLTVFKQINSTDRTILWQLSTSKGRMWTRATFHVNSSVPYEIILRAVKGSGSRGYFAVDDINYSASTCTVTPIDARVVNPSTTPSAPVKTTPSGPTVPPSPYDCTFENGFCNWQQAKDDKADWSIGTGRTYTRQKGPVRDHTLGTVTGHYMYLRNTYFWRANVTARLVSPKLFNIHQACFSFWYHMYGEHVDSLNIYSYSRNRKKLLWSRTGTLMRKWYQGFTNVYAMDHSQIFIEASRNKRNSGNIAVDDIKILKGPCPEKRNTCDFENGDICFFKQVKSDQFDWSIGPSPTNPYLPKKDRTERTGSGKFLYADGNHNVNSTAQILTPVNQYHYSSCTRFWYNLNNSMALNVYLVSAGKKKMINSFKEDTKSKWIYGSASIISRSTWEVMFEADITARSPTAYIALDDVSIEHKSCGMRGDCTFEYSMCEWLNERNKQIDNFDWIVKKGEVGGTGPSTDHTLQTSQGSYLFIEGSSPQKSGDMALLNGPSITYYPSRRCLKFWYSIHAGQLEIGYEKKYKEFAVLWRVFGSHGEPTGWKHAQMPMTNLGMHHRLQIRGIIGTGGKSYIALDDLVFHSTSCSREPTESDPKNTTPTPMPTPATRPPFVAHSIYDCSFENDFCNWKNPLKGDHFDWKRQQGPTPTVLTGPNFDHTLGTAKGWYIYIEADNRKKGEKAILVSKPFLSNQKQCFSFYYHMFGTSLGKLDVILNLESGPNLTMWTKSTNHGQIWLKESFRIPEQKSPYTISFVGEVGNYIRGDIALDDIRVQTGDCPDSGPLNCTFEVVHLCGFETPQNNGATWRKHAFGNGGRFGPTNDHTLSSIDGAYMYLELPTNGKGFGQVQLVSPVIKKADDLCMTFYYQMAGHSSGSLSVYQQIGNTNSTPIWVHWVDRPSWWTKGQVTLPANENYKVIFEGQLHNSRSAIMIDDISTVPGICPEPGNCNFERGNCGWNYRKGQKYWKRSRGQSPTANTGPTTDHTTGLDSGYYLLVEATFANPSDAARLQSMSFPPTSKRCMRFWYHMYGRQMGKLKIYFVDTKTNQHKTAIWELSGNQGNKWQFAQVAFAWSDVYNIIIEGTVGTGTYSDIAIDDIMFTADYCATLPVTAATDYHFPEQTTTVHTPTWGPTYIDCDFESGICNWQQGRNDDFDWRLNLGRTTSRRTGPRNDHTLKTNKGHYVYIETRISQKMNSRAHLESPTFVPTQTGCLQFWYFMYGPDVNTLNIYIKDKGNLTAVWTRTGTIDPAWHQALVPIQSDDSIQIVIEGLKGRRWKGDIAVDDIAFSFDGCKTSTDMTCGFEESRMCGFTQSRKDDFDWRWFRVRKYFLNHHRDHTFGAKEGHYMWATQLKPVLGSKAIIVSPTYTAKVSKCVEFWYYMSKENSGTLNVYSAINGTRMKLWSRSGDQGNIWSVAQASVVTSGKFNVEIEAVSDRTGIDISIDDFGLLEGECPKAGNCDFESGWCTWNNNQTDDFDWQIGTGYLGMFGAPNQDHTTDSKPGHFLFLPSNFRLGKGSRAELISEVFDGTYHDCMTFWYHMHGAGTGTINIYTVMPGLKKLSWTMTGNQQSLYWSYGQFPVTHKNQAFKIMIEGITGESNQINIAIDDIFFSDEKCGWFPRSAFTAAPTQMTTPMLPTTTLRPTPVPTEFDCTFEKDMCQWKQDKSDKFDWIRSQGPKGSTVSGPLKDHTRGNDDGWYIFTDLAGTRELFEKSRLLGPVIQATDDRCFNLWYHMYGSYISTLSVILSVNGKEETRWRKSGDQGDSWQEVAFNLMANKDTKYQIILEASRTLLTTGEIAIDDIRFTKNKCHADNPNYCDFESGYCGYVQVKTDDFNWKRVMGRFAKPEAGPSSDHTTGTGYGYYVFIEKDLQKENQKAQLKSPKYNSTDLKCLHFHYHMYGDNVDELNVYKVDVTHLGEMDTPIWSRKYSQGEDWQEGQVSIFPGDNYHIIFEGKIGKGGHGNIALDDIYQTPGACQPPGFCDFENGLCSWKNIKSDQFDWLRGKGYTDTEQTGPSSDHTSGSPEGYYVYLETSDPQAQGDTALLQSVDFPPSNSTLCVRFWYQMNGVDVNTLNVHVQNVNEKGKGLLWTQSGNKGPEWLYGQVNVDPTYTNKPYYVLFEGIRGEGYNGDIAIDDIEVSHGECIIMPDYADPKALALTKVGCDFDDQNACEWQQSTKDDLDWKFLDGPTGILNTGPKIDHSGSGYYLYTKNHKFTRGIRAVLKTPILGPTTGEGNCFTFYYFMYGMQIGTLNIYTVINNNKTLHWTKTGEQGADWRYAHFNIKSALNYQIYIESITSGHFYDVIALDDLAMVANPCPAARVCDFDVNLCGWTPQNSSPKWIHAMNPSPIADHTTGTKTGGLLYTNSSLTKTPTKYRMATPVYPPATKSCLKFWYQMKSSKPGTLNVYVDMTYAERRIWSREQNQGDFWWHAHVEVGRPEVTIIQPYRLIFESVQDSSDNGIIAIDDVEHLPGPCFNNGVCDFEQDTCGFSNIKQDDFDWIRASGKTDTANTGPSADHSLQDPTGHYMVIEASGIRARAKGLLVSWVLEKTTGTCFKFWYNMYGSGMGTLNIYKWSPSATSLLWSKSGDQGQNWKSASITIVSTEVFAVVFEGIRGYSVSSDMAIDDLVFLDGSCETQTTPSAEIITQPPTAASLFACDFERNYCGWEQDTTSDSYWSRASGSSFSGGPRSDHTKDNKMGTYIWLESSNMKDNRTARLMSSIIYQSQPVCLTFWYHMHGENPGTLNVYVRNMGQNKDPEWTRSGEYGTAWRYAEIEIEKPEKGNRIYFEAIRAGGRGDIALDDIALLLDSCPPRVFCDFEEPDICGYEQGDTDVFDWTRGSGATPTHGTGPINDHTYGTEYGHYMYIEVSQKGKNDHAHLYSPVYPATSQDRCLSFWYNMHGRDIARLSVYLYQNNKIGDKIWSLQLNQGRHWHFATAPVSSVTPFQILFEGIREKGEYGDIAIDDVMISKEPCNPVASCTFEEGFCGWENFHWDSEDWQRVEASMSVKPSGKDVGPRIDHTIGDQSGFYMLVDPIHWIENNTAKLRSQTIPLLPTNPESYCFHFWYVLYGANIGALQVRINYHGDRMETIWSETGQNDTQWHEGFVLMNQPYSDFEILVVAVAGNGNVGFMAIDDLELLPGICPDMKPPQFTCKSGHKIPINKVCDFIKDCPYADDEENCGSCTFEGDMCSWIDRSWGIHNWTRIQGKNNISKINKDHTFSTEKGWFARVGKHRGRHNHNVVLQNRALQQTSSTCQVKFAYYLTGAAEMSLTVGALERGRLTNLYEISHDRGSQWNTAIADIGKISRPFKLQFIAKTSNNGHPEIALDDIEFKDCNFPAPQKECASTEFQCKSKGCVDKSRICDLSDDCGDRSDETNCEDYVSCDFENSLCTWSQDTTDNFDWTRINEATETDQSGPSRDHSKGTASGYYIYAEASNRKKGDTTRLLSAVIQPPKGDNQCWIRFFYHMRGYQMGSLNVYTRTSLLGAYNKIWTKFGHIGDLWERADVKLSSDKNFQVVFEAVIKGYSSDMALDDITFTKGCQLADLNVMLPNGTKEKPTESKCGSGLFQCKDLGCVLQSKVCDFTKDCKDGSDEDICGTCNFENGNCGWGEQSTGRFKWQSHQGDSPGKFGPINDHTSGSDIGKYMLVLGAYGIYEDHALLESRPLGHTQSTCQVEFYVYMLGNGAGMISLNIIDPITHKVKTQVTTVKGNQGDQWKKIVGNIGAQPVGFALQFDAFPNVQHLANGHHTDMAIDDVKLINCGQNPTTTKQPVIIPVTKPHPGVSTKRVLPGVKTTPGKAVKPTTIPSKVVTKGPKVCGKGKFSCPTATFLCFSLAYRCDGHEDCPDGYDEKDCQTCPQGKTFCIPENHCIISHRCDNIADCSDGSDEAGCDECPDGYCLNGGTCIMENGSPKCQCKDKNANFRCVLPSAQKSKSKKVWVIPVGVVLALLITAALLSAIYYFWIRKSQSFTPATEDIGIANPAYDYGTDLPTEFPMRDLEPAFNDRETPQPPKNPTSIENPLYGH